MAAVSLLSLVLSEDEFKILNDSIKIKLEEVFKKHEYDSNHLNIKFAKLQTQSGKWILRWWYLFAKWMWVNKDCYYVFFYRATVFWVGFSASATTRSIPKRGIFNSRTDRWESQGRGWSCLFTRSAQTCWIKTGFVSYTYVYLVIHIYKLMSITGLKLFSKIGRKKRKHF